MYFPDILGHKNNPIYQDIHPALFIDHLSTELPDAREGCEVTLLDPDKYSLKWC